MAINWMVCQDDAGNEDGPVFDGKPGKPRWSIYADTPALDNREAISGPRYGEWEMYLYRESVTRPKAYLLARDYGLTGTPIGGH